MSRDRIHAPTSNAATATGEFEGNTNSIDGTKTRVDVASLDDLAFTTELTGDISGTTSEVQIKVGGQDVPLRRFLYIENTSTIDIFVGPTGVDAGGTVDPGMKLRPGEWAKWEGALARLTRFVISTASFTATVQEAK